MKALIDTNVIIDAITARDYDYKDSQNIIRLVLRGVFVGVITAKQITDIYYILRKYIDSEDKRRETINLIIDSFEVLPTLKSDLKYCINSSINDYEDAILDEVAKVNCINYIITNNIKDYKSSSRVILAPKDALALIDN